MPDPSPFARPAGSGARVVAEGEGLALLALESGHFWQTLWDLPENAELREARGHPEVLLPGDRVTIPPLRSKSVAAVTNKVHRFRRRGMPVPLTYVIRDGAGDPLGSLRYELVVGTASFAGTSKSDGSLTHFADPLAATGTLTVWPALEGYPEKVTWTIALDRLNPVDTVRGMISRLNSLGYAAGAVEEPLSAPARQALMEFQQAEALEVTGEIDTATIDAMRTRFGH